jgi:integrase
MVAARSFPSRGAQLPALAELADDARGYVAASLAPATRRAYAQDWRIFSEWCAERGLEALPADPRTLVLYLTDMATQRSVALLQRRLTSISQAHQSAGYDTPTQDPLVRRAWKGIRRTHGVASVGKAPLRSTGIRRLVATLDCSTLIGLRDRALLVVGFAGAFRRSELVALDVADVDCGDDGLVVHIRRSKTDQEGEGASIGLPFGSDPATCPVRTLRAWLDAAPCFVGQDRLRDPVAAHRQVPVDGVGRPAVRQCQRVDVLPQGRGRVTVLKGAWAWRRSSASTSPEATSVSRSPELTARHRTTWLARPPTGEHPVAAPARPDQERGRPAVVSRVRSAPIDPAPQGRLPTARRSRPPGRWQR